MLTVVPEENIGNGKCLEDKVWLRQYYVALATMVPLRRCNATAKLHITPLVEDEHVGKNYSIRYPNDGISDKSCYRFADERSFHNSVNVAD